MERLIYNECYPPHPTSYRTPFGGNTVTIEFLKIALKNGVIEKINHKEWDDMIEKVGNKIGFDKLNNTEYHLIYDGGLEPSW
jgi:hypothetical protein